MKKILFKKQDIITFLCMGLSCIMLTIIQAPWHCSFLAWFAYIPFILAAGAAISGKRLFAISYLAAMVYWLGNLYWLTYITWLGYVLFAAYLAIYQPVIALCLRFVRQRMPSYLFLFVPLVIVGAETGQSTLLTGFNWYLLAHSQYDNLPIIQIADIFGAGGVSFIIASVSGCVCQLILGFGQKKIFSTANIAALLFTGLVLTATLIYGHAKLNILAGCVSYGPVVGCVQPAVPSEVKESPDSGDLTFSELTANSTAALGSPSGATLIAWPETIVPATLNHEAIALLDTDSPSVAYHNRIKEFAKNKGYILVGAHSALPGLTPSDYRQYNSAFLYTPQGRQDFRRYDKIHLVPFGEFIPFKDTWIYRIILKLSPYDYDYNLSRGTELTRFEIPDNSRTRQFGVLICYEDTDPELTRKIVRPDASSPKADWLVNISNDAWYAKYKNQQIYPSVELPQRTAISVFRSVENRITIMRSVNMGISCLIEPTGRIKNGFLHGTLPQNAMARQAVAGWFTDRPPIDKTITFFTRHGRILDNACGTVLLILLLIAIILSWRPIR